MAKPDEEGFITCTKCERRLPGTQEYYFQQREAFYPHCKECKGSEFGIQKPNYALDARQGHKYCSQCIKELPATNEYFFTDRSCEDGLTTACKPCLNGTDYGIHKPNAGREDGLWKCTGCGETFERTTENFYTQGDRLSAHCKSCHTNKRNDARRENRHGAENKLSGEKWKRVKEEYNHECAYCGCCVNSFHRDHIVPVSKGGSTTISNIVPSCEDCNLSKSDKRVSEWYPKQEFYSPERMDRILNTPITAYNAE